MWHPFEDTPFGRALVRDCGTSNLPRARWTWSGSGPSLAEDPRFRVLGHGEEDAFVSMWASGSSASDLGAEIELYGARIAQSIAHTLGDQTLFDDAFPRHPIVRLEVVPRGGGRLDHVITTLQPDDDAAAAAAVRVRARWASQLDALEARVTPFAPREPTWVLAAVPAFVALARRETRIEAVGRAVRIVVPDDGTLAALMGSVNADGT